LRANSLLNISNHCCSFCLFFVENEAIQPEQDSSRCPIGSAKTPTTELLLISFLLF
jgi:hypothetical protein